MMALSPSILINLQTKQSLEMMFDPRLMAANSSGGISQA
jgi:hypothetical protein